MLNPKEVIDEMVRTCTERGLSLRDVCKVANVNIATVNRWRAGTNEPRFTKLARIQRAIERLSAGRSRAA